MSIDEKTVTIKRVGASMKDEYIDLLEKGYKPEDIKKYTEEMTKKKPEQVKEIKPTRPTKTMSPSTSIGSIEQDIAYLKQNDFGSQKMAAEHKLLCPNCGDNTAVCPECGKQYNHGEKSHCDRPACKKVNAPLDCNGCGMVVEEKAKGVLDFENNFLPYDKEHKDPREDLHIYKGSSGNNCPIKNGKNPEASEDLESLKKNDFSKKATPKKAAKMDAFVRQYLETALWSSIEGEEGTPLDDNYDISDFSEEAIQTAIKECDEFREAAGEVLSEYDPSTAGHDFWLTRNRHGVGFWDGDYEESDGKTLTKIAHEFGEKYLYAGDDGKLYFG